MQYTKFLVLSYVVFNSWIPNFPLTSNFEWQNFADIFFEKMSNIIKKLENLFKTHSRKFSRKKCHLCSKSDDWWKVAAFFMEPKNVTPHNSTSFHKITDPFIGEWTKVRQSIYLSVQYISFSCASSQHLLPSISFNTHQITNCHSMLWLMHNF